MYVPQEHQAPSVPSRSRPSRSSGTWYGALQDTTQRAQLRGYLQPAVILSLTATPDADASSCVPGGAKKELLCVFIVSMAACPFLRRPQVARPSAPPQAIEFVVKWKVPVPDSPVARPFSLSLGGMGHVLNENDCSPLAKSGTSLFSPPSSTCSPQVIRPPQQPNPKYVRVVV